MRMPLAIRYSARLRRYAYAGLRAAFLPSIYCRRRRYAADFRRLLPFSRRRHVTPFRRHATPPPVFSRHELRAADAVDATLRLMLTAHVWF